MSVIDINDAPVFISASSFNLDENTPAGVVVFTLLTSDEDTALHGDYSTFRLQSSGGTAASFLQVMLSGNLTATRPLDFETDPRVYQLNVIATDSGVPPLSVSTTVTVNLMDVNDAPTFPAGNPITVVLPENAVPGPPFYTVVVADEDIPLHGDTFLFAVTGGNTSVFFVDPVLGQLSSRQTFNFENQTGVGNLSVQITVTDSGVPPMSSTENITVVIGDV